MNIFSPDSKLMQILTRAGELLAVNILWAICCVPILTIGPSTTAMYVVVRRVARGDGSTVIPEFFRAFAQNFKKSFLLGLILLIPMLLAAGYLFLLTTGGGIRDTWFRVFGWIAVVIIGMVWSYVWPLTAWFENSLGNTLKNAFLLPLSSPVAGLFCAGMNLLPWIILTVNLEAFMRISFLWLIIGAALTAFYITKLLLLQFKPLLPAEPEEEDSDD